MVFVWLIGEKGDIPYRLWWTWFSKPSNFHPLTPSQMVMEI